MDDFTVHYTFGIDKTTALLIFAIVILIFAAIMVYPMAITHAAKPPNAPIIITY